MGMENGEIDLIDLYGAFKKTATYRILNNAYELIIGNKLWFTVFIVVGVAAGYFINMNKEPLFKSEVLVKSYEINNYVSQSIVSGLNSLIEEGNHTELIKNGLNEELSSKIKSIEFVASENSTRIFTLELFAFSIDSLKQIETTLINYLNNNNYSLRLKKENLKQFHSERMELLTEINELDSIGLLIKNQLKSTQKSIYTFPSDVSKEKLRAKIKVIKLDRLILNSNNYQVLNGFTPTNSPEPGKGNYPLKFALLAFVLGFIILRIFKK